MTAPPTLLDALLALRDVQRRQRQGAAMVIKERDLPLEINALGRMRWYLHPSLLDRAVQSMLVSVVELLPGEVSGRLRYQGGSVIFCVAGTVQTTIDDVVYEWSADDCLNVPIREDGVAIQHRNVSDGPAKLLEASPNLVHALGVDRGSGFEILEPARINPGE